MGLQDRDCMRERRLERSPFTPPTAQSVGWLALTIFLTLAAGLYLGYDWLIAQKAAGGPLAQTEGDKTPPGWQRCVVNGHGVFSPTIRPSLGTGSAEGERRTAPVPRNTLQETLGFITPYHCKACSGGTFWTNSHCNQHRALVDRMVEVPARLAFSQQLKMAEGNRRAAAVLLPASPQSVAVPTVSQRGECDPLAQQIQHWDAMARQPQSAQMQDWVRAERHKTRDRQWALRC